MRQSDSGGLAQTNGQTFVDFTSHFAFHVPFAVHFGRKLIIVHESLYELPTLHPEVLLSILCDAACIVT